MDKVKSIKLTDEQRKVVEDFGATMRVLAGPGTGKTFCIVERIRHLLSTRKISSKEICAITFTTAAAGQLRERLEEKGFNPSSLPYVNTLHGLAMGILKKHFKRVGLRKNFRPVDNIVERIIIKDVVEDLKANSMNLSRSDIKKFKDAFFQNKTKSRIPNHTIRTPQEGKILTKFVSSYSDNLSFYNAVDWQDILHKSIELVDYYSDIKKNIYKKTQYLLVDEYQDLNPLEQEFVDKICGNAKGLCVVGDDDQSIYETFRFADPQGLIDFPKRYEGTNEHYITLCRRCPPKVIEYALKLIKHNDKRVKEKKLVPFDMTRRGFALVLALRSKKGEIDFVVSKITTLLQKGYKPEDIMILFTDGKVAKDYIFSLKNASIPVDIHLKISHIFRTEYFIWLLSTLRWLSDNKDNLSVRQCLEYWEGIGPETVRQLRLLALSMNIDLWDIIKNITENPSAFKHIRQRNRVISFFKYFNSLKKVKQFSEIIEIFFKYIPEAKDDRGCNILYEHLKELDDNMDMVTINEVLEDFELKIESGELENKYSKEQKGVRVMSMHLAKGCEAPIVFLPALEDDIIPGSHSNIEEQRRLFYVSLTRAKVGVFLTWAKQRTGQEIHMHNRRMLNKKRSQFLDEINV